MKKRKILSSAGLLTLCAMIASPIGASAEKTVMNDDFQGYAAGQLIQKGGNYDLVSGSIGNDVLQITADGENLYMKGMFTGASAKKQYFGKKNVDFKGGTKISFRVNPISGKGTDITVETDGFERLSILRFYDGGIYLMSGINERRIGKYEENTWYDVSLDIHGMVMDAKIGEYSLTVPVTPKLGANKDLYFVMNNHGYNMEVGWDDIRLEYDTQADNSTSGAIEDIQLYELKAAMKGLEAYKDGSPRVFTEDGILMMTDSFDKVAYKNESGELMLPTEFVNEHYKLNYEDEYISLNKVASDMNRFTYYDEKYNNWILGTRIDPFNGDSALQQDLSRRIRYPRPSGETVVEDMFKNRGYNSHPRILATNEDFERIKKLIETDELAKKWYDEIDKAADKYLESKVDYSKITVKKYDKYNTFNLAFMYKMTGDTKYAEELWKYCDAFVQFEEWTLTNTIETAEIASILGLIYDWCYDYFNDSQKTLIKNAVFEKALILADAVYRGDFMNCGKMVTWWPNCDHNWNLVCNGGFGIAALAFAEYDEDLAKRIVGASIKGIEGAMESFGDNGGWDEGPGYWKYGTQYLYRYFEVLDSATGVDYGYMNIPYLAQTSLFPMYTSTNNGKFGYGDGTQGLIDASELMYSGKKLKDRGYVNLRIMNIEEQGMNVNIDDLLFYTPDEYEKETDWPTDRYFDTTETTVFRGSWNDPYSTYIAFHGGLNNVNHGHLDIGEFCMDALGERWFTSLDNDSYSFTGYHDRTVGGLRWNYYRCRAEGSNTLVINPGVEADQEVTARSTLLKKVSGEDGGYAIMDMTAAYPDVKMLHRGIKLYDGRSKVIVQDEIEAKKPSEIYWFGHTAAEIEIQEGGKCAVLTSGGKKLQAQIISPANAEFSVMEAKPLPTSPQGKNSDNSMYKKLTVHLTNVLNTRIEIAFIPLYDGEISNDLPKNQPMSKWYVSGEEKDADSVTGITVGNNALEEFNFNRNHYTYGVYSTSKGLPEVNVQTGDGYKAEIKQANDIYTPAIINVKDNSGREIENYYVYFERLGLPVTVHSVSSEPEVENGKENAIDGSTLTRWASQGKEEWIILDLGEEKTINTVAMSWYNGNQRISYFDIDASTDCENWTQVYKGESSGNSNNAEFFGFEEIKARYVRINCHGTSTGVWNSITTINIFEP